MNIIIDGEKVDSKILEQQIQQTKQQNPEISDEEAKKSATQSVLDWTIIRRTVEEKDYELSSKEVDAAFENLVGQFGGKQQFFQRHNLTGKDEPKVREDIENNLKVSKFMEELTEDVEEPSSEDVEAFYNQNKESFKNPYQIHVAHIVKHPNQSNAEEIYKEMVDIRTKVMDGELDFDKAADDLSDCQDAGGDLGFFARGKMVPAFEAIVFSMRENEISPVFQTQFGFHVATVLETKEESQKTLEEARDEIVKQLHYDLKNKSIGEWVDARKEEADIQIKDEEASDE